MMVQWKCKMWKRWCHLVATRGNLIWRRSLSFQSTTAAIAEPSLKRRRSLYLDSGPSVHVTYKCLTRESRKKLQEVLRGWAEWQGHTTTSSNGTNGDFLESGSEMYFPALQVGSGSSQKMPFWMDVPTKQVGFEQQTGEISLADSQEREVEVPLYDRACNSALSSQDSASQLERPFEMSEEASRCFNCGSYSHGLKDCPRPRDNAAISVARKLHTSKKGLAPGPRGPSRYYQSSPGGKFDDLKPGVLGAETRQSLGIGELDPPPWLNRMRELGYPPGYLDGGEDEPSGITIFDGEEEQEKKETTEDGEILDTSMPVANGSTLSKKMVVGFPGLNAPIPKDADEKLWKQSSESRHAFTGRSKMHQSQTKTSVQQTSWGNPGPVSIPSYPNPMDSPSELFHPQGLQAHGHLSSKSGPILHRSFSDNSRRGQSNDVEDSSPMPGEFYRSTSGHTSFTRHDGLLSHPPSYLPPRSPAPYLHSPSQHSQSPRHAYDSLRERTSSRQHAHTPPASSQHNHRHGSSSHHRSRSNH
ncbi:hypothetical protein O6H91_05G006400 [Diphasiastrum complanatum]|uniref:Uncharacterized protein n=1 Tax=Diphasiastrum complanatum TaxID=34168 RepID=A0ACC2DKG5_DIPCM|nr:hypothetical protein O6H91_05G006400 [Diphasiastrum complanatum]